MQRSTNYKLSVNEINDFIGVHDALRIHVREQKKYKYRYAITLTQRKGIKFVNSFRNEFYLTLTQIQNTDGFNLIMEYHERKNALHAHGYLYTNVHQETNGNYYIADGKYNVYVSADADTLKLSDNLKWYDYCTKQLDHTLERDRNNGNGVYDRFRKYGKRTRFLEVEDNKFESMEVSSDSEVSF